MLFLFCYDIEDDKRRTAISKLMEANGTRVQKSVFECQLDITQAVELGNKALGMMNPATDSLRVYRMCGNCIKCFKSYGIDRPIGPMYIA